MKSIKVIRTGDLVEKLSGKGVGARGKVIDCDPAYSISPKRVRVDIDREHLGTVFEESVLTRNRFIVAIRTYWSPTSVWKVISS